MITRTVTVVTGTRAEYGLMRSTMEAIEVSDELDLSIVATGMHLSRRHGYTVDDIVADGFDVDREVNMLLAGDTPRSMAKSLGIGISGVAEALGEIEPDLVLVLGDRGEAFAGGVVAAHMNIPVAHVHGGDVTGGGTIDDSIRHALTKFTHLHFPATDRSRDRILSLGEEEWRTRTVGAPGLDDVLTGAYEDGDEVRRELGIETGRPLLVVVQHPVTDEAGHARQQMRTTLNAVSDFDADTVIVYSNSDAGGDAMIDAIESHEDRESLQVFSNLPRERFLGLLEAADVLVGNSSSGLIEAPSFDLPVVNVGNRQDGRERAGNVVQVDHVSAEIHAAIERCLEDEEFRRQVAECENPYSRGGAAERIVECLESVPIDDRLLRKRGSP